MASNDLLEPPASMSDGHAGNLARSRTRRAGPKPLPMRATHQANTQVSYLLVSSMVPGPEISYIDKSRLESWLATKAGVRRAMLFRPIHLLRMTKRTRPYEDIQTLVSDIRAFTHSLQAAGIDALVIDTMATLYRNQRESFIYAVTHIWLSGIDVVVVDADNQSTSFNDLCEVVNGQDFIRTYINSIWNEAQENTPHRRQRAPLTTRTARA